MLYTDIKELKEVYRCELYKEQTTNYGDSIMRIYPTGNKLIKLGEGITLYMTKKYMEVIVY